MMSPSGSNLGRTLAAPILFLLASTQAASAQQTVPVTLLSSQSCIRTTGDPNSCEFTFPAVAGEAVLHVYNGHVDGVGRTSSATVTLNGQVVVAAYRFNQQVSRFDISVTVAEQNTLTVQIAGRPDSVLAVAVLQDVRAEAAAVIGPSGGVVEVASAESPLKGTTVRIPIGALADNVVVSIASLPDLTMTYNPEKEEGVSLPGFELLPAGLTFAGPVQIQVPYPDANADGLLDGTNLPVTGAQVYFLSEPEAMWYMVPAVVDPNERSVTATTRHFSKWSIWYGRWKDGSRVDYYIASLPSPSTGGSGPSRNDISTAFGAWSDAVNRIVTLANATGSFAGDVRIRSIDLCAWQNAMGEYCEAAAVTSRSYQKLGTPTFTFTVSFNTDDDWMWVNTNYSSYDPEAYAPRHGRPFLRVALHEFGHVMGLGEYTDVSTWQPCNAFSFDTYPTSGGAVMYYECGVFFRPLTALSSFDRREARALYGIGDSGVDQQQIVLDPNPFGTLAIGGDSEQKLAQVITVGKTGSLVEVRFPLGCGPDAILRTEVQGVTDGLPNGRVIALQSTAGSILSWPEIGFVNSIIFTNPAYVVAGSEIALVLSATRNSCGMWPGPVGNPYPGGDAYYDSRPNVPGVWVPMSYGRQDLVFQTIVR